MSYIDNYKTIKILGKGSYGVVYEVKHKNTNTRYALKLENKQKKSLFNEINILEKLKKIDNVIKINDYGIYNDCYYFVMERLGMSLEDYYQCTEKQKSFMKFMLQTMVSLKSIQQRGIIHRDIKPDNIILNTELTKVYIIDFGISKKFLDKNRKHKPKKIHHKVQGTVRYASIFNHEGIEQSRRDDIISFLYSMIYILKRGLPWQNMKDDGKFLKILSKKKAIENEELCSGLHSHFSELLNYCYMLKYEEEPDYDYIILKLTNINKLYL